MKFSEISNFFTKEPQVPKGLIDGSKIPEITVPDSKRIKVGTELMVAWGYGTDIVKFWVQLKKFEKSGNLTCVVKTNPHTSTPFDVGSSITIEPNNVLQIR